MSAALMDLARAHAPLLMVACPLVGAALVLVLGVARLAWVAAFVAMGVGAYIAIDFASIVLSSVQQPIAIVGIALHIDGAGVFAAALLALTAGSVALAIGLTLNDAGSTVTPFGLVLMLCLVAGWSAALMLRDLVALIVAVEIAWLAAVGLTALHAERDRASLNGAFRMLTLGGVSTVLMLVGAGLIGRAAGGYLLDTLPFVQIGLPHLVSVGVALVVLGLAVKAGAAPLHAWAAPALGRATPTISLVAGVLGILGALSVLTRFAAYAISAPQIGAAVSAVLAALGAVSVVVGSMQAVGSQNLQRLAAYAGVSQTGCILLSVGLGSPAGFAAALVQLAAFAAAGIALYGGASAGRVQSLVMLDGYARRAPLASATIAAGALSLMGAPLTLGFLGRWRLVEASVGAGWWWAVGLVVVSSLAGVFYGGRLIERMYFRRGNTTYAGEGGVWRVALAPALIGAIAIGLAPAPLLNAAAAASLMLTGISP